LSLPFERRIIELEGLLGKATSEQERKEYAQELEREQQTVFANLSAWQRVQLARHPLRPRMLDYTSRILDDLIELHGDRVSGDDSATVAGVGRFQGQTVVVVGHQKGASTDEKVNRNFGMAGPRGYRKALRLFQLAERFQFPVITLVDTPAADPGVESETWGQGPAIANNLLSLLAIQTPVFSVVLSEGGSGGALGVAVGDWIAMLEHAIYVVCPPERCAEILWRNVDQKEEAAAAMRVTAADLLEFGVIDAIVPEPPGGAHRDPDRAADALREEIDRFLSESKKGRWSLTRRQEKFRRMGVWQDAG
jgi:acetyl-CoA carboxylase carboxyl transferase subunit alpha